MKPEKLIALFTGILLSSAVAQDPPADPAPAPAPAIDTTSIKIEAHGVRNNPPPLFFSARANSTITATSKSWTSETQIQFELLQGTPDVFTLKLIGDGEVTAVTGEGILDWSVRRSGDTRLLDIRPKKGVKALTAKVQSSQDRLELPVELKPITFGPGKSVGFSSLLTLNADPSVDLRVTKADGLAPAQTPDENSRQWRFQAQGDHELVLKLSRDGAALAPVELVNAKIEGSIDKGTNSTNFVLTAEARVTPEDGGKIDILSGHAAVTALPQDENFTLSLHNAAKPIYRLTFPKAGTFPVRIEFQAGLLKDNNWTYIDFRVPAGAVVPVTLAGIEDDVRFAPNSPVFPTKKDASYVGFLPPSGHCKVTWQAARDAEDGKLFYSSDTRVETRVGAGLMRQLTTVQLKILQGKLDGVKILIEGEGEILGVDGDDVLSWAVNPAGDGQRMLEIHSSRPATGIVNFVVRSRTPVGDFPLEVTPMRFTPQGTVRHSGYLTVLSEGAVALEITKPVGLIQMAPGAPPAGVRQIFVYRFPSAQHSYSISARQIFPEVNVSQTTVYQMTDTDRLIVGRVELDIAKAPLREWTFNVPKEYALINAGGAEYADAILIEDKETGEKSVKILFKRPVEGRQLIEFSLGRSMAAADGIWALQPLEFPGAKSVRGNIGVATVPGFRVTPGKLDQLTEVPQNLFPFQFTGLQQTFRQREATWSADVQVDALPQSVQADVFHLYTLKQGIAHGSVLIDYFVIGSPVSEWRIKVPEEIGNIAIESQNVQGWTREGDEVVVNLHQAALGAVRLLLTFEQPMNARGGILKPGQIAPSNVQGERGYIQIVSPVQVRQKITKASTELLKMEAVELPPDVRLLTSSPSLAVYQYSSREFELEMDVQWYQPGEMIEQVVDFAELKSHVSSDGQVVTDALFFVKTRGRKALRLKLAEGTKLWETRVDGQTVSPKIDGSELLIPIEGSIDPSRPVQVLVSIGQSSADAKRPVVTAPILLAPTLINSWEVKGDPGRRLLPAGKNTPSLAKPFRTETGFQWIANRGREALPWLAIAILAGSVLCCRACAGGARQFLGLVVLLGAIGISLFLAVEAESNRKVNLSTLDFVAPVIEPGEVVSLELRDVAPWQALVSMPGLIAVLVGLGLLVLSFIAKPMRLLALPAWCLIAGGLLAQHGGAIPFFVALAIFILLHVVFPTARQWLRTVSAPQQTPPSTDDEPPTDPKPDNTDPPASTSAVASILILACALGLVSGKAEAAADEHPIADTSTQTLRIENGRLFGKLEIKVTGKASDTVHLLRAPAVLTEFQSDGMRVTKRSNAGGPTEYWAVLERDGTIGATASYELPVGDTPGAFNLPTNAAAVQQVDIRVDQGGWQIDSGSAVRTEPIADLPAGSSGARLILGPSSAAQITLQRKTRDLAAEEATFYAEVSNLFIPGPGIVDGRHNIIIRPSRGQLSKLDCTVPEGFTVSEVRSGGLSGWRYDPDANTLQIDFNPPQSKPFALAVETQQGSTALPTDLILKPIIVQAASGQVGMLGVAFGPDSQPEKSTPEGLSKVNVEDFDSTLIAGLPKTAENVPTHTMHEAYRYGAAGGELKLTVGPVAADIRTITKQTVSLGEERLVVAIDLGVNITRSGIFKLSFEIPDGLEIESISGDSLASHTESTQDGKRVATLHLKGSTIGSQRFAISLAGPSPDTQKEWVMPKFSLRESSRATGQILIVPEQGIRVKPVARDNVQQIDSRKLSENRPGTLAFRLLHADWELKLQLETLDPWVTAQVLQEVTAREGLTKTRLRIAYNVENAAVKSLLIKLPGISGDEQKTVRASGTAVRHIAKAEGEDIWEIHFQRRILGGGTIDIDYQRTTDRKGGGEDISVAELASARQSTYWVVVRVSDHLEVDPVGPVHSGWQSVDWSSIPANLAGQRNLDVPDLTYRASSPDRPLSVKVQRLALADALALRVSGGEFTTVVAPDGATVTEARMLVEVVEKSTLRVVIPEGATLINTFVNGQSAGVVREEEGASNDKKGGSDPRAYMFYVLPPEEDGPAEVSIAWSLPATDGKKFQLAGPSLNIPLQNIKWEVILPTGHTATGVGGTLDLIGDSEDIHYNLSDYIKQQRAQQRMESEDANRLMVQANQWKAAGEQEKARSAYSKLSRKSNLSAAVNEDARVQLHELQSQRTRLSLATRSQRNYFFNVGEDPSFSRNKSLENAADRNPLLQGKTNYDPDDFEVLIAGNSSVETANDNRITARLVSQQIAAEPASQAIEITLPGEGHRMTFGRSVQVDGNTPLELELKIKKQNKSQLWVMFPILFLIAIVFLSTCCRRKES